MECNKMTYSIKGKKIVRFVKKKIGICKIVISRTTLTNTLQLLKSKEKLLIAYWATGIKSTNWGDALNPILIQKLSGKTPILAQEIVNLTDQDIYSVIGSTLGFFPEKNLVVWGSGFISTSSRFTEEPKKIYAVRGPLTRKLILNQGIFCPKIYGDPALLYPLFYKPNIERKYKLGIIPHYADQNSNLLNTFKTNSEVLVINILSSTNEVVDNICKCERIASSSLHGIIAADAYGIPSIWVEFSENVIGNGFKFYDYFESVGRKNERPHRITENTTFNDILGIFKSYKINIDLSQLLDVCPFIERQEVNVLKRKLKELDQ
ncbi:polysaccharide pyruvyl transferase family protein [Methanosarcina mazei]|nr:polysaccharide pyruvyl transferase family protein [Methanosarcina mazei]UWJ21321.1 GumL protein [Methanosarcina mazei TMA]